MFNFCYLSDPGYHWFLSRWKHGVIIWRMFRHCLPWRRHQMETFSALLALCAGNSPVTGEFPTQWPVTRSFDVFFDLRLNIRLSKQSWGWWVQTPSRPLWCHYNDRGVIIWRMFRHCLHFHNVRCRHWRLCHQNDGIIGNKLTSQARDTFDTFLSNNFWILKLP